jgi:hypothetical protein
MWYMIRKEFLDKFKKLYKEKYSIELTDEETTELAQHFLNLMDILIHPKHKPSIQTDTLWESNPHKEEHLCA